MNEMSVRGKQDLLIGGRRVAPLSGRYFETLNLATAQVIALGAKAGVEDVDAPVRSARAGIRGRMGQYKSKRARQAVAQACRSDPPVGRRTGALESLDSGKSVSAIRRQDLPAVIHTLTYYAGIADKINGQVIPARTYASTYTVREPLGVVGAIIPWNSPLMIGMWKLVPPPACGWTVVLKPAEVTPHTALGNGELALEAGFPAGVLNVVPGFGKIAGQARARHRKLRRSPHECT